MSLVQSPPTPVRPPAPASETTAPSLLHSSFYRFVHLPDPEAAAHELRSLGRAMGLGGSVVVAAEGVNGTVAGPATQVEAFEQRLRTGAVLQGLLRGLTFKRSACSQPPFGRFKVSVKPEIVALGLPSDGQASPVELPDERDASHLSPAAWRQLLAEGRAVVLDNRNHFEFRLGHFRGAVDPGVHHFRDFVRYVEQHAPAWRAQGRPVAMYCTGGIRCDKTAPWMRSLGLEVLQLEGGILNYLQQAQGKGGSEGTERDDSADRMQPSCEPKGRAQDAAPEDLQSAWQGECFVFDRRIALDAQLRETGTTAEQVFDPAHPDEAWRLQRARRLDEAA
jgi:UPF0176 protein